MPVERRHLEGIRFGEQNLISIVTEIVIGLARLDESSEFCT